MDSITINELEVFLRVGVPDAERATPQRLLLTVELSLDTRAGAAADDLQQTVDYFALYQRLRTMGTDREWRLIETLAKDVAAVALEHPLVQSVQVEVQKFILPGTRNVAVRIARTRA
ncbi:MAG TPA: dihydroneopterin aldolase [Verrucomicrobiales bacterium]|nr:dihydroneopterin aldolase [Verrucomicrobiales bacterium]